MDTKQAIAVQAAQIRELVNASKTMAAKRLDAIREDAHTSLSSSLNEEIQRLTILKTSNPNITDQDINELEEQRDEMSQLIDKASIKLDAVRLIVVSD